MRQAAKRDANEAAIVEALLVAGATVERLSAKDVPDLLVGFRGNNYLIEVKDGSKQLSDGQTQFFMDWEGQCFVVRSIDEALEVIGR